MDWVVLCRIDGRQMDGLERDEIGRDELLIVNRRGSKLAAGDRSLDIRPRYPNYSIQPTDASSPAVSSSFVSAIASVTGDLAAPLQRLERHPAVVKRLLNFAQSVRGGLSRLKQSDRPPIRDRPMGLGSLASPAPDRLVSIPHCTTSDRN